MAHVSEIKTAKERIEDALREIGTLLVTFAPLDAALNRDANVFSLLIFVVIGIIVFAAALLLERRRRDAVQ